MKLKHSKINYKKQQASHSPHLTSNRFNRLAFTDGCNDSDLRNSASVNATNSTSERKQPANTIKKPKLNIKTKKTNLIRSHKVLLVGDSHIRGIASEVKVRLSDEYEVIGYTNPGSTMKAIKEITSSKLHHLTKKDIVILGGGATDVAKNNSLTGIKHILDLSIHASHTNVIQLSVPHRYDLSNESCVNREVWKFNNRLRIGLNCFNNITMIEAPDERELYTRHGLHLNLKGKETMASKIAAAIENVLQRNTKPISMSWMGTTRTTNTLDSCTTTNDHQANGNISTWSPPVPDNTQLTEIESTRSSNRVRKNPTVRYNDFLWTTKT